MPCDWPIDRTCLPDLPALSDPPTPDEQAAFDAAQAQQYDAEDLAISVLWALSGRQFGLCPDTVRPCPAGLSPWHGRDRFERGFYSYVLSWERDGWMTWPCGCGSRCRVGGPRAIHLPGPVAEITAVTIGDTVLDDTEYVIEGDVLYRREKAWPGQDLGRPLGEPGTWSVEYVRGYAPPRGTANMVGTLAKEFITACSGDKCRLPRTVTVANRNGVTFRAYDPTAIYSDGKTGIPEIDLWLAAVNPNHLAAAPVVI